MGPSPMALPVPLFPPVGAGRELVPVNDVYDNNFANMGDADVKMQWKKARRRKGRNVTTRSGCAQSASYRC